MGLAFCRCSRQALCACTDEAAVQLIIDEEEKELFLVREQTADQIERLRRSMQGLGTDGSLLVRTLADNARERCDELNEAFKEKYDSDVLHWIRGDCSGAFERLCVDLASRRETVDAVDLRKAMKGLGTDDECLREILLARDPIAMERIREEFQARFGESLSAWIEGDEKWDLERLLLSRVDPVTYVAQALKNAMDGMGTNNRKLILILTRLRRNDTFQAMMREPSAGELRPYEELVHLVRHECCGPTIRQVKQRYLELYGQSLLERVQEEADIESHYGQMLAAMVEDTEEQNARWLKEALHPMWTGGWGTHDEELILLGALLSPSERFRARQKYDAMFSAGEQLVDAEDGGAVPYSKLLDDIADDTSAGYKKALLGLFRPTTELLADMCFSAMNRPGTDERQLSRIFTQATAAELQAIQLVYEAKYGSSLRQEVIEETSLSYREGLCYLLDRALLKRTYVPKHELAFHGNVYGAELPPPPEEQRPPTATHLRGIDGWVDRRRQKSEVEIYNPLSRTGIAEGVEAQPVSEAAAADSDSG